MRNLIPSRVAGEPQPASKAYKTRQGAENHAAREQAYSDRIGESLRWDVSEVEEGGFAVFCTEVSA